MDYEKLYKDSLDRAKKVLNTPYTAHFDKYKELIEYIFPVLKEPDDERIRKNIILSIKEFGLGGYGDISEEQMIEWLEKQKPNNFSEINSTKSVG